MHLSWAKGWNCPWGETFKQVELDKISFELRGNAREPEQAIQTRPPLVPLNTPELDLLRREIVQHQKEEERRSYLSSAIAFVTESFHGNKNSLSKMEATLSRAELHAAQGNARELAEMHPEIKSVLRTDESSRSSAASWSRHGASFAKSLGLFLPGKSGYFVTALTSAADSARASDSAMHQSLDIAVGLGKGAALKFTFDKIAASEINLAGKAFLMGTSSKISDVALDSHTYLDPNSGKLDVGAGLWKAAKTIADPAQIANDMLIFGVGYGGLRSLGMSAQFAKSNPILANTMVGTSFGMSGGFFGELQRQRALGQDLNMAALLQSTLIEGALTGTAASIGGYRQMQLSRYERAAGTDKVLAAQNVELKVEPKVSSADALSNGKAREFLVSQDISGLLNRLRTAQAETLTVRELHSNPSGASTLGEPRTMTIQHIGPGVKINRELASRSDLVACCGPEALAAGQRNKFVFPEASPGSRVALELQGKDRLRFTLEESPSIKSADSMVLGSKSVSELIRKMDINEPFALTKDIGLIAKAMESYKGEASHIIGGVTGLAIQLTNGKVLRVTDLPVDPSWGKRTIKADGRTIRMDAKFDELKQVRIGDETVSYYVQDKLQSPISAKDFKLIENLIKKDKAWDFWDNHQGQRQFGYEQLPNGGKAIVLLDYDAVRPAGKAPTFERQPAWYQQDD